MNSKDCDFCFFFFLLKLNLTPIHDQFNSVFLLLSHAAMRRKSHSFTYIGVFKLSKQLGLSRFCSATFKQLLGF